MQVQPVTQARAFKGTQCEDNIPDHDVLQLRFFS
jgi:hypothetical protein